jgi:hypothetical protein
MSLTLPGNLDVSQGVGVIILVVIIAVVVIFGLIFDVV